MFRRITISHLLWATVMVAGMLSMVFTGMSVTTYLALTMGLLVGRVGLGMRRFRQRGESLQPVDLVILVVGSVVVANLCALVPGMVFYGVALLLWGQPGSTAVHLGLASGATLAVVAWLTDRFLRVGAALEPNLEKVLWNRPGRVELGD